MAARLLNLILGILLTAVGWAIVDPAGPVGAYLPRMALGAFEGHRPFIGWGVLALGVVSLLSAVSPRDGGPKGGRKRPPAVDFDAAPDSDPVDDAPHTAVHDAIHTAAAEPGPFPTTEETEASPLVQSSGGAETFPDLRNRLRDLVDAEAWSEAAALARRLSTSADSDEERMAAAGDLGDFARVHGNAEEAANAYSTALAYARQLHAAAPGDPARAADLAGALTGTGDVAQDEGRLDAALEAYEEALALRRAVAEATPSAETSRALSLALERLADAREDRGHRSRALDLYRESFDIAGDLAALDPQAYGEDLAVTRRRLGELEARLTG